MLRRVAAAFVTASLAACAHAPPPRDDASEALAAHEGPLAVDHEGRWQPTLDVQVRFAGASLVAMDSNGQVTAAVLRHRGEVTLGKSSVASGDGLVLVVVDGDGALRWKQELPADDDRVLRVRVTADGAVFLAHGSGEHRRFGTRNGEGKLAQERGEGGPERILTGDAHAYDQMVLVGEADAPLHDAADPWRAFVEIVGQRGHGSQRQVFGSEQPIHLAGVDASLEGWIYLTGTFSGTLGVAGHGVSAPARAPFVAALDSEGHIAWLAPLFPPATGGSMEPVALHVSTEGVRVGLALAAADGTRRFVDASLDGQGALGRSCELGSAPAGAELHELVFADELTVLHLGGAALFFAPGCKPVGRFEPRAGERLVAVRPLGERILVGVDAAGAAELRWYRK